MNARDLLKSLMRRAGDNANTLAAEAEVPKASLYRFLSGSSKQPAPGILETVAQHYGIPVEAFFSEKVSDQVAESLLFRQGVKTDVWKPNTNPHVEDGGPQELERSAPDVPQQSATKRSA